MHRFILILTLLTFTWLTAKAQNDTVRVTWAYAGRSFDELANETEARYHISFFYMEEWVKDLKVPDMGSSPLLTDLLNRCLDSRGLHYSLDKSGNVVLTGTLMIKEFEVSSSDTGKYISTKKVSEQTPVQRRASSFYEVGNPAEKGRSGSVSLKGSVRDIETGKPIPGVTVFIRDLSRGTVTDESGFYLINIPRGTYNIRYSFLGMKETSITARIYGSGTLEIDMAEDYIPIEGAVITAQREDFVRRIETGLEKINIATSRLMPTSLGETDIIKNMLLLPGVKTVGEASQGFNVRGGAADQNLMLLYKAPVYNPAHFFGFFTSVNSDIIKDLYLYKGGIPAKYGGRLSSVIDIMERDGDMEEFRGKAGISPITAHLLVEFPIIRNKLSLLATGRTTYSDWIMKLVNDPTLQRSSASFYDFNGQLTWQPDKENRIVLATYRSFDSFRLNSDTTYRYYNRIESLSWTRSLSGGKSLSMTVARSDYEYQIGSSSNIQYAFAMKYRLTNTAVKSEFQWSPAEKHRISIGLETAFYNVLPGEIAPTHDSSIVALKTIENDRALETGIFIEDKVTLSDKFAFSAGLRFSLFSAIGGRMIRLYDEGLPRSNATIYDTLFIPDGRFYKTYSGPEYRLSLNYMITGHSSLKISYNRTRQYLHLMTNSVSISPTDIWKLSDYYLKPQVADQVSAGYYLTTSWNNMELSGEVYYKPIRNMVDFKGGALLTMNESIEKDIVNVNGRAYGLELMMKKSSGKFSWSLGYTYSRILLRSNSEFESEEINGGKWFPASYDKPHDLSLTCNFVMTRRLNFSFNYLYSTGRPITYPTGTYTARGLWVIDYSDRNKYRIPDYMRLDVSLRLTGNLKSHKLMNPAWTFSCYNLLSRPNVYSEYFVVTGNSLTAYRLSIFARAISTLTYSFEF